MDWAPLFRTLPTIEMSDSVALVHDYLTQRGGAERVVLTLLRAFPGAPIFTSFYEPSTTFPDFAAVDIHPVPLNRLRLLRRNHRLALPLLAPAFSRFVAVNADVVVCSSSGWAHGARVSGRKIVYCHTPARWLYQPERYLRGRGAGVRAMAAALRPALVRWDRAAASSADTYVANSSAVAERIARIYGIEAEIVPPPPALTPEGPTEPYDGLEPGFLLCVSRLLPYKNVDAVVRAFAELPEERLVVAGTGPAQEAVRALAGPNVTFLGRVTDAELRWLYAASDAIVAAAHEDFGLTPLEGASFGKPAAVLRWGGFLDTVEEGESGIFFESPTAEAVANAVRELRAAPWQEEAIRKQAARFSEARYIDRMRAIAGLAH